MRVDASFPRIRQHHRVLTRDALVNLFEDQRISVVTLGKALGPNWDDRLRAVLLERNRATARDIGNRIAEALKSPFDPDLMDPWLDNNARITAEGLNGVTRERLGSVSDDEGRSGVFDTLVASTAINAARELVTRTANFAAHDAARNGGGTKTWVWSGKGQRHADMAGQTVPVSGNFSNGMAWPGDPAGGADENADCACSIEFGGAA